MSQSKTLTTIELQPRDVQDLMRIAAMAEEWGMPESRRLEFRDSCADLMESLDDQYGKLGVTDAVFGFEPPNDDTYEFKLSDESLDGMENSLSALKRRLGCHPARAIVARVERRVSRSR